MNEETSSDKTDNKINEVVQKYVDTYNDNSTKFSKINILLPSFLFDLVNEGFDSVEQVRMSNGIFVTLIVNDYYEYIQKLYNINPELYDEERLKYVRKQVHITITPETMETIEEIKKLIGTSDKVGVVKSAVEHYVRTKKEIILTESILEDDD